MISIEPHPINYRLLEINKITNNAQNVHPVNAAIVSAKVVTIRPYESSHSGEASIMMKNSSKCYEVASLTLSKIIENYVNQGKSVFLKIDVEGAEFDIFKHLNSSVLKHIEAIVGGIHLKHGNVNDIVEKLRSEGFQIKYFHPPLIAKNAKPLIKVEDMLKLKIIRSAIYSIASVCKLEDENLLILFAWREL